MRIYIGPYKKWWGPYQVMELLTWVGVNKDYCEYLADKLPNWTHTLCSWVHNLCSKRKIKIKLHPYDTWSMDATLAHIIVPMLEQLRDTKHGSPYIDNMDVPEQWRMSKEEQDLFDNCRGYDEYAGSSDYIQAEYKFHDRYKWVLGEMIWVFNLYINDSLLDIDESGNHRCRKEHAMYMFGKYFDTLWD